MRSRARLVLLALADFILAAADVVFPPQVAPGPTGYRLSPEAARLIDALRNGATVEEDTQPYRPVDMAELE